MTLFTPTRATALLSLLFGLCALVFIHGRSFVIDDQRYYVLADDSMISMRYAAHLVEGHGFVWNVGEAPIEGFTNMAYTLLMAACIALFGPLTAVLAMQLVGLVCLLAVALLAYRIARLVIPASPWAAVGVYALTLAYLPSATLALQGVETALLTALTLAALYATLHPTRDKALIPVLVGLSFWVRPDGMVLMLPIWLYHVWASTDRKRALLTEGLILAAFIGSLTLFRLIYFGHVVPNTYTLKVDGIPLMERIENGIGYIRPFIATIGLPLVVVIAALIRRKSQVVLFCLALIGMGVGYQIWVGGDVVRNWRMLAPVIPILFILAVWALQASSQRVVLAGVAALMLLMNAAFIPDLVSGQTTTPGIGYNLTRIALALKAISTDDATLAVFSAGSIPYYSEMRSIDCLGKSEATIARLPPDLSGAVSWEGMTSVPGHNKYDLEYCIGQRQADYAQNMEWGQQDLSGSHPEYRRFAYRGVELWLNTRSEKVRWDLVQPID